MTIAKEHTKRIQRTIYIDPDNDKKINLLPKKRHIKSDFVNKAIKREFQRMEEEKLRKEALDSIDKLYKMRVKSDRSVVEEIRKIRHERVNHISNAKFHKDKI